MKIQAVFFDMGGTIDTYGYNREFRLERTLGIQEYLLSAGIDLGISIMNLYEVVSEGLARYHAWSLESLEELPPQSVWGDYILPEYPVDRNALDAIAEDLMCFIETQYYERAMRPEIPMVLEEIKQMGLKIGMISNVNSRGQVPTNLATYNIGHYFNPIVLSSEYGRRKPDPIHHKCDWTKKYHTQPNHNQILLTYPSTNRVKPGRSQFRSIWFEKPVTVLHKIGRNRPGPDWTENPDRAYPLIW